MMRLLVASEPSNQVRPTPERKTSSKEKTLFPKREGWVLVDKDSCLAMVSRSGSSL
jgi:hypothetical protein